jgi:hypothetical protein
VIRLVGGGRKDCDMIRLALRNVEGDAAALKPGGPTLRWLGEGVKGGGRGAPNGVWKRRRK